MIVFTGGGTGGHIYPALEIARMAHEEGAELCYFGSLRGQEKSACQQQGVEFFGFGSRPLYSLRKVSGWVSLAHLARSTIEAKKHLRQVGAQAVFATGGYAAAPVMQAAKSLKIPLMVHETNSVPGRSNLMFSTYCQAFSCVFEHTLKVVPKAQRLGQPIRKVLREAASKTGNQTKAQILGIGGSQGAQFINDQFPKALKELGSDLKALLVTGKGGKVQTDSLPALEVKEFLQAQGMADAYLNTTLAVARSGGTLAELAAFRIPSVLIPLPTAAGNHQFFNAKEFEVMGAATVLDQNNMGPNELAVAIQGWLDQDDCVSKARASLANWDCPQASEKIWETLKGLIKH